MSMEDRPCNLSVCSAPAKQYFFDPVIHIAFSNITNRPSVADQHEAVDVHYLLNPRSFRSQSIVEAALYFSF